MPTYEYTCQKCGHQFETVQSMSATTLTVCPKDQCPRPRWGKGAVKRGIGGGAGLIFKGSGFYLTDYRSEGYKASAKADSTPNPSGDTKPSGDAKPAGDSKPTTEAKPAGDSKPAAAASKPAPPAPKSSGGTSAK